MITTPEFVGLYASDDFIDVRFGTLAEARRLHASIPNLASVLPVPGGGKVRYELNRSRPEKFLDEIMDVVLKVTPRPRAVCLASYGPFRTIAPSDRLSPDYGRVMSSSTPVNRPFFDKPLGQLIRRRVHSDCVVTVVPDVTAAAVGELYHRCTHNGQWRTDARKEVLAFGKVSFGIGGAFVHGTAPWQGRHHPEAGQIFVARWRGEDPDAELNFHGTCHVHHGCLEGLASVPAIVERVSGRQANSYDLRDMYDYFEGLTGQRNHWCWDREAYYLAQYCAAITSLTAPKQIVLGGRVMDVDRPRDDEGVEPDFWFLDKVREQFRTLYVGVGGAIYDDVKVRDFIDHYSRDPKEGRPGARGAVCIAAWES